MTYAEYGAWFVGFSEAMPCPPGAAFLEAIGRRVAEIDGQAISHGTLADAGSPAIPYAAGSASLDAMERLGHLQARALLGRR